MSEPETKRPRPDFLVLLILIVGGTAGSAIAGWIHAGALVFNTANPSFEYYVFGVGGSLLFAIHAEGGLRTSLYYAVPLAMLAGLARPATYLIEFTDAIFLFLMMSLAYHFIWTFYSTRVAFGKFLLLGLSLQAFELVKTPFLRFLYGSEQYLGVLNENLFMTGTIGLGLGLGIEVAEQIISRLDHRGSMYRMQ